MLTTEQFEGLSPGSVVYIDKDFKYVEPDGPDPDYNKHMEEIAERGGPHIVKKIDSFGWITLDCGWYWVKEWLSVDCDDCVAQPVSFDGLF